MTMRAPFDPDSAATSLIDKRIGSAFDKVNAVADALGTITYVANNLGAILGVGGTHGQSTFNVKLFGAVGDGETDDTEAFLAAAASLTEGGVLWLPPGNYLLSYGIPLKNGVHVRGAGRSATRVTAKPDYPGSTMGAAYSFFYNENWSAASLAEGNHDISVAGITFDYSWRTTTNAFKPLNFRHVTRLWIADNYFYYGGNAIGCRGCDQVVVERNAAYEFRNCAWDFWEGPGTTHILNNYAETSDTAQMANYNPEYSPVASSPLDVFGVTLVMKGNTFKATVNHEPCQIEPLSNRQNGIRSVIITQNHFYRTYLVHRGYVENLVINGNIFSDFPDPSSNAIRIHANNGFTPKLISISDNIIEDPKTSISSYGVIRCEADTAIVTGNIITGTDYEGIPFYAGSAKPVQYGNYFEKWGSTGRLRQGFVLTNPNDSVENSRSCYGWEDLDGDSLRMYMNGNFHEFHSTNANGTPRQVWSLQANNNVSQLNLMVGLLVSNGVLRVSPALDLVATGNSPGGALNLTKNFNEVVTVGAGTGVRLPASGATSNSGMPVVVFNRGANTLNVFPPGGGYINGLAADEPDTIPAGGSKTYYAARSTHYYTW